MSDEFVDQIRRLVAKDDYRFSQHAATELVNDQILVTEPVARPETWRTVEFYPDFHKGKAVLVLQPATANGPALHLLWGVAAGYDRPAVLITAYRPDTERWTEDLLRRRR